MTHNINATPTFQSSLPVPDDGDPAQASAPGTPPELATLEEIAQTILDNTKALESWAVSTLFPANKNNTLGVGTFDPRLLGRMWSRPQGMSANEWQLVDDSIDWTDRDFFVVHKTVFVDPLSARGQSGDWNQSAAVSIEYQWGYLRLPGSDAGGIDPRTSGATPVNNTTSHAILFSSGLRLFVREGKLYAFNAHTGPRAPEFWIFASGKTTTGDGGSASADGSTTVVGGGNAVQIQGRNVSAAAPSSGNTLVWNSTTNVWEPGAGGGGLAAGNAGAVLFWNSTASAWQSNAAPAAVGKFLRSNGTAAPTWDTLALGQLGVANTWTAENTFAVVAFDRPVRSIAKTVSTTTYTLALADQGNIRCTNAAARTITLFDPAAEDGGLEWRIHDAARTADSAPITITAPSGVTLNGVDGGSVTLDTKGGAAIVRVLSESAWETVGL